MVQYDQPRRPNVPDGDQVTSSLAQTASTIVASAWHNMALVVTLTIVGLLGAVGVSALVPATYVATAQILVDPTDLNLLENDLARRPEAADSGATISETQVKILSSDSVLSRVVDELQLGQNPIFNRRPFWRDDGLLEHCFVALGAATSNGDSKPEQVALDRLRTALTIRRTERTFVIDIVAKSVIPDLSANVANAVASAYLAEKSDVRADAARRASADFSANLDPLRSAVRQADDAVVAFRTEHRLVGGTGGLVTDQQINEATAALSRAREAATQARTRFNQMQGAAKLDSEDNLPDVVQSTELRYLRQSLDELQRQQAELGGHLGPRFPEMIDLTAKIVQAKRAISAQIKRLISSAKNDLDRATAVETGLEMELDRLRNEANSNAAANVTLRQLQDDLDAKRSIYDSYLRRAKETSEQGRIDATNARIITVAQAPRQRNFPPPPGVLLPLGTLAGLALGVALSYVHRQRRRPPPGTHPKLGQPLASRVQTKTA